MFRNNAKWILKKTSMLLDNYKFILLHQRLILNRIREVAEVNGECAMSYSRFSVCVADPLWCIRTPNAPNATKVVGIECTDFNQMLRIIV
jgi:hypothetical protein